MKTIEPSTRIDQLISNLRSIADELQTLSKTHTPNSNPDHALLLKAHLTYTAKELSIKAAEEHLYCKLEALLTDRKRHDPENHYQVLERLYSHINQLDFDD